VRLSFSSPSVRDTSNAHLGLDFTTLVSNLDNTASEIVAFQRDSTVQRKDLAQKTKDFRKLDDASKLTEIKGLLKGTPSHWSSVDCPSRD
jgi:outer membrane scaffolding protein for murein synthesis (MipA/OmpV family)